MANYTERVFIVGGTGNIGVKTVSDLLAKKVAVTLYARSPSKIASLFPTDANLNTVQGDFNDLSALKEGIKGHTRLFLLVGDLQNFVKIKSAIATYAYEAGVKQIVDISSISASSSWRSNYGGIIHAEGEEAILKIPNRGAFVALRPGRFMSNALTFTRPTPDDKVIDISDANKPQGWISPNDVGAIAATVLTDDIEKHGDYVYELVGDAVTPIEQAQIFSNVMGREITYQRISALDRYNYFISLGLFTHQFAYGLVSMDLEEPAVSQGIPILLGREPQTLEQFITLNKNLL